MRWLAFVALLLSGCDYIFRLDEVEIRSDGSANDGTDFEAGLAGVKGNDVEIFRHLNECP